MKTKFYRTMRTIAALAALLLMLTACAAPTQSGSDASPSATAETPAPDAEPIAPAVSDAPEPSAEPEQIDYTGRWFLDDEATMAGLTSHEDVYMLFGSGLREFGAEMVIAEDGTFRCSVGVGYFLEGTWTMDGDTLRVEGQNGVNEQASEIFTPAENGTEALCMTYDNEKVYWRHTAALPEAVRETVDVIREYGFYQNGQQNDGDSVLSFTFDSASLEAVDGGYLMDVTLAKEVTVPGDLPVGGRVTITLDELTGETETLEKTTEDNCFKRADSDLDDEYYTHGPNDDGTVTLFMFSDDRVDCPFYKGQLFIADSAVYGIAILDEYHCVTQDDLSSDPWINGVKIDPFGYVTSLVFYGD